MRATTGARNSHLNDAFIKRMRGNGIVWPTELKNIAHVINSRGKTQSRSQSFVPPGQRSENESSGSIHFEITIGNNQILVIRFTAQSQSASMVCYGACMRWMLPEFSLSDRWSRRTKLWERDIELWVKMVYVMYVLDSAHVKVRRLNRSRSFAVVFDNPVDPNTNL